VGTNIFVAANNFNLKTNPKLITVDNSDAAYFNSDLKKANISLIGGVNTTRQVKISFSANETALYQNWSRRWDKSFSQFCQRTLYKMHPLNRNYTFRSKPFEMNLWHRMPSEIVNTQYIKSKDAYWNFPPDLFATQPGVASNKHEVKFRLIKHILHPFQFEPSPGAFIESNVTTIEVYSLDSRRIPVLLNSNSPNYISFKEPYVSTRGYADEWLRCMSWDEKNYTFINDGACGFQKMWEEIPCQDCDAYNKVYASISLCRCKEIRSQLAVVAFQVNGTTYGQGFKNSIYTDFFAMKYWQESFGYIAALAGIVVLIAGHVLIALLDGRLRRNLVIRLREKARQFELKYGAAMQRTDGLFLMIPDKKAPVKKAFTEGASEEQKEGLLP
jgi:hypothetical protein